ncbi:hypothetical protein Emag_000885 [Eimeria magna]
MAARRSGRFQQQQQQQQQQRFRRGRGGRRGGGARGGRGRRGAGPRGAPPTIEGLDAQLEAYMGEDVVKQRLDRDLDAYFSATATDSAAAAAPAPETDAGPMPGAYAIGCGPAAAMEVTMEASTFSCSSSSNCSSSSSSGISTAAAIRQQKMEAAACAAQSNLGAPHIAGQQGAFFQGGVAGPLESLLTCTRRLRQLQGALHWKGGAPKGIALRLPTEGGPLWMGGPPGFLLNAGVCPGSGQACGQKASALPLYRHPCLEGGPPIEGLSASWGPPALLPSQQGATVRALRSQRAKGQGLLLRGLPSEAPAAAHVVQQQHQQQQQPWHRRQRRRLQTFSHLLQQQQQEQQKQQQQQRQHRRGFGFVRPHVWRRALPAAVSSVSSLSPGALCCALREAAAKGLTSGLFWKEADRRLLFVVGNLSPAALAAAAAAFATAAHRNPEVLKRIELRAIQLKNVNPRP